MAFKMSGWSAFTKTIAKEKDVEKDKGTGLLPSEMEGTHVYKGGNIREKLADVRDRIEFINEDISNSPPATKQQRDDLARLHEEEVSLKKQLNK